MGWYMDELPLIINNIIKILFFFIFIRAILFALGFQINIPVIDPIFQSMWGAFRSIAKF